MASQTARPPEALMCERRLSSTCILLVLVALGSPELRAEEPARKVVRLGFVHPQSPSTANRGVTAFWERLRELGWVDGQNLVTEARWADDGSSGFPH
jgi:hypothetical protein